MEVYVNNANTQVGISPVFNTVQVNPDLNSTVVQVITPGPQGPPGDPGDPSLFTSSFVSTSSFNAFTSSYNTGSFTGVFTGDGSGLTGLPSAQWTGSSDGSISRYSDVYVTGSFGVTNQAGTSLFLINAQGATSVKSTAANIFLVQNQNNVNILTVSQSGIIVVATQSVELNGPAPNGAIYFTSNSFFVGLD
jgi:hypothetical protein